MEVQIFFYGRDRSGGSTICGPISDRLRLLLGEYGTAVESIWLFMHAGKSAGKLTSAESKKFGKLPRRSFNRNKKRITGHFHYQAFADADENIDEYSVTKANQAIPEVIESLEYLHGIVRTSDDFDYEAFLADVTQGLKNPFKSLAEIQRNEMARLDSLRAEAKERLAEPAELDSWIDTFVIEVDQGILNSNGDRSAYLNQFTCISDWFSDLLHRKYRGTTRSLHIRLSSDDSKREMVGTACFSWPFPFAEFDSTRAMAKKEMIAAMLRDALIWIAEKRNQDPGAIRSAYEEVKRNEFARTGELRKRVSSQKLVARLQYEHSLEGFELFAVFSKPRSKSVLARHAMGLCPYRPWLLDALPKFCSWKGSKFIIEIPHVDWTASVETKGLIDKKK